MSQLTMKKIYQHIDEHPYLVECLQHVEDTARMFVEQCGNKIMRRQPATFVSNVATWWLVGNEGSERYRDEIYVDMLETVALKAHFREELRLLGKLMLEEYDARVASGSAAELGCTRDMIAERNERLTETAFLR